VGAGGGRGERVFEFVEGEEDVHGRGAEGLPRRGRTRAMRNGGGGALGGRRDGVRYAEKAD
jgi:hypothetical protein